MVVVAVQLLVQLLLLLGQAIPATCRINEAAGVTADLAHAVDVDTLESLISMPQMCFLAAQPVPELAGQSVYTSVRGFEAPGG